VIVVDTNIIAYYWITGEYTDKVEQLFLKDPDWHVPLLWRSELRNVLAGYLRRGILTIDVVMEILENAEWQFKDKEYLISSVDVMNFVSQSQCSAYDCEFVALAHDLKVYLITTDKQLLSEFPQIALSIEQYLSS